MAFVLLSVIYSVLLFLFGVFTSYLLTKEELLNKFSIGILKTSTEKRGVILIGIVTLILIFSALYFTILKATLSD